MGRRIGNRIQQAFDEAERQRCCLAPTTLADERWLQRNVRKGKVLRPEVGMYVRPEYWEELDPLERAMHRMRTLAAKHPTWVFAGTSAALAHGLQLDYRAVDKLCLSTSAQSRTAPKGSHTHIVVTGDHPVRREGVVVTSFARTIYDCLRMLPFPSALAVADSALRIKCISRSRLAVTESKVCGTRRGLKRVLDIIDLADGRAENGGESKVRAAIISLGFESPDLQRVFADRLNPSQDYRVDFAWELPDKTVVVGELDGKDKYVDPQMTEGKSAGEVLFAERRREAHLTLADKPVRVMRFSYAEACDRQFFEHLLSSYGVPRAESVPQVALCP